jgi:hypothetical protein
MIHVFVYVIRAKNDPFFGIKNRIIKDNFGKIFDIRLTESELDCISRVEYSERRIFRAFYYQKLFKSIKIKLDILLKNLQGMRANVYFSDEGVWAALWMQYRTQLNNNLVRGINVQHGNALLRESRFRPVRRIINLVSSFITGFPSIGYGSLGGAGQKAFDLYLTYDQDTADFIKIRAHCLAIPTPRLIKHDLIQSFTSISKRGSKRELQALFAMSPKIRGSGIKCNVTDALNELLNLASKLNSKGVRLLIRLHPGMNRKNELRVFLNHPISKFSEIEDEISLAESMSNSFIVMSFMSTILWEGGILGIFPLQIVCRCCDMVELSFRVDKLDLSNNIELQLSKFIERAKIPQNENWPDLENAEWACLKLALDCQTA